MIAKQIFEDLSSKISETLANSPAKDLEKNAKAMLSGALNRMDVVTRNDYDIHERLLIDAIIKMGELEQRIAALEAQLNPPAVSNPPADPVSTDEKIAE